MKYIRTKDGIIIPFLDEDKETKLPYRDLRFYYTKPDEVIAFIGKDEIIKQADTIEELCDEFVYLFKGRHFYCRWNKLIKKWQTLPELFEMSDDKIKTIKGAIWTDKGLIYVAKMNEKGELELL